MSHTSGHLTLTWIGQNLNGNFWASWFIFVVFTRLYATSQWDGDIPTHQFPILDVIIVTFPCLLFPCDAHLSLLHVLLPCHVPLLRSFFKLYHELPSSVPAKVYVTYVFNQTPFCRLIGFSDLMIKFQQYIFINVDSFSRWRSLGGMVRPFLTTNDP